MGLNKRDQAAGLSIGLLIGVIFGAICALALIWFLLGERVAGFSAV